LKPGHACDPIACLSVYTMDSSINPRLCHACDPIACLWGPCTMDSSINPRLCHACDPIACLWGPCTMDSSINPRLCHACDPIACLWGPCTMDSSINPRLCHACDPITCLVLTTFFSLTYVSACTIRITLKGNTKEDFLSTQEYDRVNSGGHVPPAWRPPMADAEAVPDPPRYHEGQHAGTATNVPIDVRTAGRNRGGMFSRFSPEITSPELMFASRILALEAAIELHTFAPLETFACVSPMPFLSSVCSSYEFAPCMPLQP
jgi:hypothetical protein